MLDYLRYRTIDRCIRNRNKNWDWKALAEACAEEIENAKGKSVETFSERTIKNDIKQMRENKTLGWFCPIKFIRKKKGETEWGYRYTDPNFKISDESLNAAEVSELLKLINLNRKNSGLKVSPVINAINKLGKIIYQYDVSEKQIIEMEQPTLIRNEEFLDMLYTSIEDDKAVNITYKKYQDPEPYSTIISPYLLKEYDNRWYLIAYNHDRKGLRTYGVERIQHINPSFAKYIEPVAFDPKTYFRNMIGVANVGEVEQIVFKVYKTGLYTVDYVRSRPLHDSQREVETSKEYSVFIMDVIPNREFEALVLSFGDFLEVLEPEVVRRKIQSRIENSLMKYKDI